MRRWVIAVGALAVLALPGLASADTDVLAAAPGPAAEAGPRPPTGAFGPTTRVLPPARPGAASSRPPRVTRAIPSGTALWELQLNLCNSGLAACYRQVNNGQSVGEARGVMQSLWPDLVTLNEVCRADVYTGLLPTMSQLWPGDMTFAAFMPATDRRTAAPYKCANGDQYGIGLLGHVPPARWHGVTTTGGTYPDAAGGRPLQDTGSPEVRAWVCAHAVGDFYGCTTHLASTSGTVAANQCAYLMTTAIPSLWASEGATEPTVVGADLNLKYHGNPDAQKCVPPGWFRKGDGDVQHVLATTSFRFDSSRSTPMRHTDHPAWLVALTAA